MLGVVAMGKDERQGCNVSYCWQQLLSFSLICWLTIDMYCWEAAKKSQAAITELLLFRKSTGVILRDALPALQRLCANGPFEDCQVQMFVKQPNRRLQQLLAVKTVNFLHDIPPHTNFYPHHTDMRSQMLYTNESFEICQERMFVKQRRKHGWRTCCRKKYLCSSKNHQISTW